MHLLRVVALLTPFILLICGTVEEHQIARRDTPQTDELIRQLQRAIDQANRCRGQLQTIKNDIQQIINVLKKVKTTRDNLRRLHAILVRVKAATTAFSVIPKIGLIFSRIKVPVTRMEASVRRAKERVESLENKVAPIRTTLERLNGFLSRAIDALNRFVSYSSKARGILIRGKICVNRLPNGLVKSKAESALERISGSVRNSGLRQLQSVFDECDRRVGAINNAIANVKRQVVGTFNRILDAVSRAVSSVMRPFENIDKLVRPIYAALNHRISIPYSFRVKVKVNTGNWWKPWEWKWKLEKKTFTFTIRRILNGINTGIRFINDKLIGAALKFLHLPSRIPLPGLPSLNIPDLNINFNFRYIEIFVGKFKFSPPQLPNFACPGISPPRPTTNYRLACEGRSLTLSCLSGKVILMRDAAYGRTNYATCPHPARSNSPCKAKHSLSTVQSICNYRQTCTVGANNRVFGDPCRGTYKYLEAKWACSAQAPTYKRLVCEHQRLILLCPYPKKIRIVSALYGRKRFDACRHPARSNLNCGSSKSVSVVSKACNGRRFCHLYASNGVYGDPCRGTFKYLEVNYRCV